MEKKRTIALLGLPSLGNTAFQPQPQPVAPAATPVPLIQQAPVYSPMPQAPVYYPQPQAYEPPPQFNPNLVAIAGLGLLGLGVYWALGGSLLPTFLKNLMKGGNPDKEQGENYALLATRFYEALGYVGGMGKDVNKLYQVAQDIADSDDKDLWQKVSKWYLKKYERDITASISNQFSAQQVKKFYEILNKQVKQDTAVQQQTNTINNTINPFSAKSEITVKQGSVNKGWLVYTPKNQDPVNIRTSPKLDNGSSVNILSNGNIAFKVPKGHDMALGIATGRVLVETTESGKTNEWVEFKIKMTNSSYNDAVKYIHDWAWNAYSFADRADWKNLKFVALDSFYGENKDKITGEGLTLYISKGLTKYASPRLQERTKTKALVGESINWTYLFAGL